MIHAEVVTHLLTSVQLTLYYGNMVGNAQPCCSCMLAASLCDACHLIFYAATQHAQEHHLPLKHTSMSLEATCQVVCQMQHSTLCFLRQAQLACEPKQLADTTPAEHKGGDNQQQAAWHYLQ